MQLKINIIPFLLILLISCSLETNQQNVEEYLKVKTEEKNNNASKTEEKINNASNENDNIIKTEFNNNNINKSGKKVSKKQNKDISNKNIPIYFIGKPYYIEGVEYIP